MNCLTFDRQTRTEHNFFSYTDYLVTLVDFPVFCASMPLSGGGSFSCEQLPMGGYVYYVWFIIIESTFKTPGKIVYHGYMFYIRGALNLRWFLFLPMFLFFASNLKN